MANFLNPLTVAPDNLTADTYFDAITKYNVSSIWIAAHLGLISFDVSVVSGNIRISLKDIEGNSPSNSNPVYSFSKKNGIPSILEYTSFITDRSIDIPAANRLGYRGATNSDSYVGYIYLFRQDGGTSWNIGVSGPGLGVSATKIVYTSTNISTGSESINSLYTGISGTVTGTVIPIQAFVGTHNGIVWLTATSGTKLKPGFTLPYIAYNFGTGVDTFLNNNTVTVTHNFNDPFARAILIGEGPSGSILRSPYDATIKQNIGTIGGISTAGFTIHTVNSNSIRLRSRWPISPGMDFINPSFAKGSSSGGPLTNIIVWPSVKGS